jgi:hypothetical protein
MDAPSEPEGLEDSAPAVPEAPEEDPVLVPTHVLAPPPVAMTPVSPVASISVPGGTVSPTAIGAPYVVASSGHVNTPDLYDPAVIDRDLRDRADFVRTQELVKIVRERGDTSDVIDALLQEMAEESAHLKYERRQAAKSGKPTVVHTTSRILALKQMAEVLLKRKDAALAERLDLKSPRFQKVFGIWMECFYDAMEKSGVPQEVISLVFETMKADMVGWEKKMDSA